MWILQKSLSSAPLTLITLTIFLQRGGQEIHRLESLDSTKSAMSGTLLLGYCLHEELVYWENKGIFVQHTSSGMHFLIYTMKLKGRLTWLICMQIWTVEVWSSKAAFEWILREQHVALCVCVKYPHAYCIPVATDGQDWRSHTAVIFFSRCPHLQLSYKLWGFGKQVDLKMKCQQIPHCTRPGSAWWGRSTRFFLRCKLMQT